MHKFSLSQYYINVIFTDSIKEFNELTGNNISDKEMSGSCSYSVDSRSVFIGVFNNSISVLAHEVYHAIVAINKLIYSKICDSNEEHNAYLTGYIFSEIIKFKKFKLI